MGNQIKHLPVELNVLTHILQEDKDFDTLAYRAWNLLDVNVWTFHILMVSPAGKSVEAYLLKAAFGKLLLQRQQLLHYCI